MLLACPECRLIVEVPQLTGHLLSQCEEVARYELCPKCNEAVRSAQMKTHSCRERKGDAVRCPLCHQDIPGGEEGWKEHILGQKPCPAHPRAHSMSSVHLRMAREQFQKSKNEGAAAVAVCGHRGAYGWFDLIVLHVTGCLQAGAGHRFRCTASSPKRRTRENRRTRLRRGGRRR